MNRILWLIVFVFSTVLADDASQVAAILGNIQTDRTVPIPFTEKRSSGLLDEPLMLSGEIVFSEDGVLTKRITQPARESVTISADSLELRRKGRIRRLSMDRRPDIRAFYAGMRARLSRDTATLFELFAATPTVNGDDWTIDLVPLSVDLQAFLEHLTVTGRGS